MWSKLWSEKSNNVRVYLLTNEVVRSLSSPLPKTIGESGLTGCIFFGQYNYKKGLIECTFRLTPLIMPLRFNLSLQVKSAYLE